MAPALNTEVKRRGDIRDAGEVNRLMLMGAGDVDEELFRDGIRHRFVIRGHGTVQGNGGKAAGQTQTEEDSRQGQPCVRY